MLLLLFRGSGAAGPPPVVDTRYPTGRGNANQSVSGKASSQQGVAGRSDGNRAVTGRVPNQQ